MSIPQTYIDMAASLVAAISVYRGLIIKKDFHILPFTGPKPAAIQIHIVVNPISFTTRPDLLNG